MREVVVVDGGVVGGTVLRGKGFIITRLYDKSNFLSSLMRYLI